MIGKGLLHTFGRNAKKAVPAKPLTKNEIDITKIDIIRKNYESGKKNP